MLQVTTEPERVGFSTERLGRIRPVFQRYIDEGKLAGVISLVARRGQVAHLEKMGMSRLETSVPMDFDTIFRIYSMTKPITTAAVMMLMEQCCLRLSDPVSAYLPEFKDMKVIARKTADGVELEDARRPISIRDLLTHTAGMSYGFDDNDYLDGLYRENLWKPLEKMDAPALAQIIPMAAKLPLAFQPGSAYRYSFAIDVLGYLVEVVSGQSFDRFLKERIFDPLGMVDTGFFVPTEKLDRLAFNYGPDEENPGKLKNIDPLDHSLYAIQDITFFSGGGGLVSTTADYLRFCQMILNGGELDGARLLGRKTVELMTLNHLPEGVFIDAERSTGFGLGGFVLTDVARSQMPGSVGSWGWGGAANTKFWIDFREKIIGILMLQYMPSDAYPLETYFRTLTYQALVD